MFISGESDYPGLYLWSQVPGLILNPLNLRLFPAGVTFCFDMVIDFYFQFNSASHHCEKDVKVMNLHARWFVRVHRWLIGTDS